MNRVVSTMRRSSNYVKQHGLRRFGREVLHRMVEHWYEHGLGIDTMGTVPLSDIGIARSDRRNSTPVSYAALFAMLRKIDGDKSDMTFLDYGTGKGRALCVAATFPFKRIMGVELSPQLARLAQLNLERMCGRKVADVDIRCQDATELDVPDDVNLIYFFNPFTGDSLRQVVDKMHTSLKRAPRAMFVLYFNNDHFDRVVAHQRWIKKIQQTQFYPDTSCGLYQTVRPTGEYQ